MVFDALLMFRLLLIRRDQPQHVHADADYADAATFSSLLLSLRCRVFFFFFFAAAAAAYAAFSLLTPC